MSGMETFPLTWSLILYAVKATIIIGLALLLVRILAGRSSLFRYTVLRITATAVLLLPAMGLILPGWGEFFPGSASLTVSGTKIFPILMAEVSPETSMQDITGILVFGFMLVWCAGTVWFLLRLITGLIYTARMVKGAQPLTAHFDLRHDDNNIAVLISHRTHAPFAWGGHRPAVVLPEQAASWPEGLMRIVLRHEFIHIERHDSVWLAAAGVVRAIFWFNPFAWMMHRRLVDEMEKSCDDAVLAGGAKPGVYARYLIDMLRYLRRPTWGVPEVAFMALTISNSMEGRIMAILKNQSRQVISPRSTLILTAILTVMLLLPLACWKHQKDEASPTANLSEELLPGSNEFIKADEMPEMVWLENPVYPPEAKDSKIEGVVYVKALVKRDGTVGGTMLLKSSGNDMLDRSAMEAALKNKFKPAMKDGKPVAIWVTYPVQFSLEERKGRGPGL